MCTTVDAHFGKAAIRKILDHEFLTLFLLPSIVLQIEQLVKHQSASSTFEPASEAMVRLVDPSIQPGAMESLAEPASEAMESLVDPGTQSGDMESLAGRTLPAYARNCRRLLNCSRVLSNCSNLDARAKLARWFLQYRRNNDNNISFGIFSNKCCIAATGYDVELALSWDQGNHGIISNKGGIISIYNVCFILRRNFSAYLRETCRGPNLDAIGRPPPTEIGRTKFWATYCFFRNTTCSTTFSAYSSSSDGWPLRPTSCLFPIPVFR